MPLNVIILGAPGAGKGTQAERLAAQERLPQISTGDVLREAARRGTALGLAARAVIDDGHFVDDATMIGLVGERLAQNDCAGGFVLDGFPRTLAQGRALDGMLAGRGTLSVVHLDVPEAELMRRLASRMVCAGCGRNRAPDAGPDGPCPDCGGEFGRRADDGEAVVRERMRVYAVQTAPLVAQYRRRPGVVAVNGHQAPARVTEAIREALGCVPAAAGPVGRS